MCPAVVLNTVYEMICEVLRFSGFSAIVSMPYCMSRDVIVGVTRCWEGWGSIRTRSIFKSNVSDESTSVKLSRNELLFEERRKK